MDRWVGTSRLHRLRSPCFCLPSPVHYMHVVYVYTDIVSFMSVHAYKHLMCCISIYATYIYIYVRYIYIYMCICVYICNPQTEVHEWQGSNYTARSAARHHGPEARAEQVLLRVKVHDMGFSES